MSRSSSFRSSSLLLRGSLALGLLFAAACTEEAGNGGDGPQSPDPVGAPPADLTAMQAPDLTAVAQPDLTVMPTPDLTSVTPPDLTGMPAVDMAMMMKGGQVAAFGPRDEVLRKVLSPPGGQPPQGQPPGNQPTAQPRLENKGLTIVSDKG